MHGKLQQLLVGAANKESNPHKRKKKTRDHYSVDIAIPPAALLLFLLFLFIHHIQCADKPTPSAVLSFLSSLSVL